MKRWIVFVFVLFGMVGCTAVSPELVPVAEPSASINLDEVTGLPLNPEVILEGEFIVEGSVVAVNVIPQDKPLFKIEAENGAVYQISPQPIPLIFMADGSDLTPLDFKIGNIVRATVFQGESEGLGGELVLSSTDLVVISLE
ncbi:MAG: hypothetical protein GY943_20465 [Chloroflexi bacterium]|nr:hypothetical protein [Chloroflexota bacterium]